MIKNENRFYSDSEKINIEITNYKAISIDKTVGNNNYYAETAVLTIDINLIWNLTVKEMEDLITQELNSTFRKGSKKYNIVDFIKPMHENFVRFKIKDLKIQAGSGYNIYQFWIQDLEEKLTKLNKSKG